MLFLRTEINLDDIIDALAWIYSHNKIDDGSLTDAVGIMMEGYDGWDIVSITDQIKERAAIMEGV